MFLLLATMLSFSWSLKADLESLNSQAQKLADAWVIADQKANPSAYRVESTITRREMLKIMMNLSGKPVGTSCATPFSDLAPTDWACKYVTSALQYGFLAKNARFRGDDQVTKIETLKMILKAKAIEVPTTTDWRMGYVQKAVSLGYISEFTDYDTKATRGFVFDFGAKTLGASSSSAQNGACKSGPIFAKNQKTGECVDFPNSCIPSGYVAVSSCGPKVASKKEVLSLVFDKNMNQKSVESNLSLAPDYDYTTQWKDARHLDLVIDDLITQETDVLVNILDKAVDESGKKLPETLVKTFKVSGETSIDFISPTGKITDVMQNITLRFSKPMISLTNLDNQPSCPFQMSPAISGKCVWITTSTVQFRPENGFPYGAKYTVVVPSGVASLAWDTLKSSKAFEIETPAFSLLASPDTLDKDQEMVFAFNDEVTLDAFKKAFSIGGKSLSDVRFAYLETETWVQWVKETHKNAVTVFPVSGDWGYDTSYSFSVAASLTSARGNIGLATPISKTIKTNAFLVSANPFVYLRADAQDKNLPSNFSFAQDKTVVFPENPQILLEFYEEVSLDPSLLSLGVPFTLQYALKNDENSKTNRVISDKKKVVVSIQGTVPATLKLGVRASKEDPSYQFVNFHTKVANEILSYTNIDYKQACMVTRNPLSSYQINKKAFVFDSYGVISWVTDVNQYTTNKSCPYQAGKNTYLINQMLNPSSSYHLIIKKDLFKDADNYPLAKDASTDFKTPVAKNEDKQVSILNAMEYTLVPKYVTPLSIAITSTNLSQVTVKVCQGTFNPVAESQMDAPVCKTKNLTVNNLWFQPNITVVELGKILGGELSKDAVRVEVSKGSSDQSVSEEKYPQISVSSFVRSNIAGVLKHATNPTVWLHNYETGENGDDAVRALECFERKYNYSAFGTFQGMSFIDKGAVSFTSKGEGLYELSKLPECGIMMATLTSGEKVYFMDSYAYYGAKTPLVYLSTDKPLYSPWETVHIKAIVRNLEAEGLKLTPTPVMLTLNDSQYKQILQKSLNLTENGTFELTYEIPKDAKLGTYSVVTDGGSINFGIEAYEKPEFEVKTEALAPSVLAPAQAKVSVQAKYYMGMNMPSGQWSYAVTKTPYLFDGGKTKGYSWGESVPYFYDYWRIPSERAINWKDGSMVLWNDGKWVIAFDIDPEENATYAVSTTITDPNTKKSVSSSAEVLGLASDTFLGIKFDKYYYQYQDTAHIWVASVDVKGDKKPQKAFTLSVYQVNYTNDENTYQTEKKETQVLKKDLSTDANGLATFDYTFAGYGEYRFEINTPDGKSLTSRVLYISGGDVLRPSDSQHSLGVITPEEHVSVGQKAEVLVQSPVAWVKALITIEKLDKVLSATVVDIKAYNSKFLIPIPKEYLPNFQVKVYIIKDMKVASDVLEKLKALRIEMLKIEQSLQKPWNFIEPIIICDSSVRGYPRAEEKLDETLLKKLSDMRKQEQSLLSDLLPNYYEWEVGFTVSTKPVEVNTVVTLDKGSYLPWDQQTIDLKLTDDAGTPINGELTLKIVDEALLALQNNQTSLLETFYQSRESTVSSQSNLQQLIKRIEFVSPQDELKSSEDSYRWGSSGGGKMDYAVMEGAAPTDAAAPMAPAMEKSMNQAVWASADKADAATKIRSEFSDIAFYKGTVTVTDGVAHIVVPKLPDNLTTWHISGFVITPDSKVGDLEKKFVVSKSLSLSPQVPSFVVSGDVFEIGGLVQNTTATPISVSVSVDAPWFDLDAKPQSVTIGANDSKLVAWKATTKKISNTDTAPIVPSKVTLKATTEGLSDTVIVPTKTVKNTTSEYVFTNGSTYDLSYEEKLTLPTYLDSQGYVEVSLGASLLTNLLQNLDAYAFFPSDDLWSKLSFLEIEWALKDLYTKTRKSDEFAKITVKDYNHVSYSLAEVEKLVLADLKNYVQADGGLAYFKDCELWGYRTTCSSRELSGKYLSLKISVSWVDTQALLEYYQNALLAEKQQNQYVFQASDFIPLSLYGKTEFINKNLLAQKEPSNQEKLAYLRVYENLKTTGPKATEYYQDLKNSLLVEARGTFLPASRFAYSNANTTAMMLSLLIEHSESEPLLKENIARWLLSHRDDAGRYFLDDVPEILRALTAYVDSTDETKWVNFEAKAYLNSQAVMTSRFDMTNLFSPDHKLFDFEKNIKFWVANSLGFEKTGSGKLYYDVGVRYYLPVSKIEPRDEGLIVERNYYDYDAYQGAFQTDCFLPWWGYEKSVWGICTQKKVKNIDTISKTQKGKMIVGVVKVIVDRERTAVQVKDYLPAGASLLNTNFNTTSQAVKDISGNSNSTWWRSGWSHTEQRDEMMYLYADFLSPWEYTFTYVLKAESAGIFALRPAVAETINTPEIWGRSGGSEFIVE